MPKAIGRLFVIAVAACTAAVLAPLSAATASSAPPTPHNFYVNNVAATRVSMQWSPGVITEPTSWRVYRNGTLVTSRPNSAFTDLDVSPGVTYSYHVVAYNSAGRTSAPTRTITVTTRGPGVSPGAPSNLRATEVSPSRITLEFDRPGDEFDVSAYRVFDGATQVATAGPSPFAAASTVVLIRNLTPASTHSYSVTASRWTHGDSAPTNTLPLSLPPKTDHQPPSAPSGLTATGSRYGCSFADLTWNQVVDNVDSPAAIDYEIFVNGSFATFTRGTGQLTTMPFPSPGNHTITVRAVDSSGNASAHSNTATFTISPWCEIEF